MVAWYLSGMAWIKVPPEHRPIFLAALPKDSRIETVPMFGGIMARANGHPFAGLFGRSAMVLLDEPDRREALALEGAGFFDPMGDGRMRSEKVMLPEAERRPAYPEESCGESEGRKAGREPEDRAHEARQGEGEEGERADEVDEGLGEAGAATGKPAVRIDEAR